MTSNRRPILAIPTGDKKVLLHSCCAPCAGDLMEAMLASGIEMTIFFYNPNIHPKKNMKYVKMKMFVLQRKWVFLL